MALAAVILAAGDGTRMKSRMPKVLHQVGGVPMIRHVLDTARALGAERRIVVAGTGSREVSDAVSALDSTAEIVVQPKRLGTGDAVLASREALSGFAGKVCVLYGDTPNLLAATVQKMASPTDDEASVTVLGFRSKTPSGYGRLICGSDGELLRIVEHKEATQAELQIDLCNGGAVCADSATLFSLLDIVDNRNAAGEFYLTDIVAIARSRGLRCRAIEGEEGEFLGVNARGDLAGAERVFQERERTRFLEQGAHLIAPETIHVGYGSRLATDVVVEPHVIIGPDVIVEEGAVIRSFSHLEGCRIGPNVTVGPFARIRPGTTLSVDSKVGNFVEVKASNVGRGSKISHLAYVGDSEVGNGANIGAGTIVCNYDGVSKHRTKIGDGAFVGSNSTLVAPVTVSSHSMTGAGSVITRDVPDEALALARGRQRNIEGAATKLFAKLRKAASYGNPGKE